MKKLIACAVILFIMGAATYFTSCKGKNTETATKNNAATSDSNQYVLDRGKYLVEHVAGCIDCHSQRDWNKYSGPVIHGTEGGGGMLFGPKWGLPGMIYARNITPDPETGIGTWTDEDILKAITQGISKRGDTLFPIMPYTNYNRMVKSDLLSIIAYIRTLKPIKNPVQPRQLMIPIAMAYPGKFLLHTVDSNRAPDPSDRVAYGRYLVYAADCGTCHSPLTPQGPDMTRIFQGGYTFELPSNKVTSANITPDSLTGIGAWSEERFLEKFMPYREESNYNVNPGNQNTIMPLSLLAGMTDDDLKAIYAFLRTIPPAKNQVEKFPK
jgi:mono/diheme cytochrome c family protein